MYLTIFNWDGKTYHIEHVKSQMAFSLLRWWTWRTYLCPFEQTF